MSKPLDTYWCADMQEPEPLGPELQAFLMPPDGEDGEARGAGKESQRRRGGGNTSRYRGDGEESTPKPKYLVSGSDSWDGSETSKMDHSRGGEQISRPGEQISSPGEQISKPGEQISRPGEIRGRGRVSIGEGFFGKRDRPFHPERSGGKRAGLETRLSGGGNFPPYLSPVPLPRTSPPVLSPGPLPRSSPPGP